MKVETVEQYQLLKWLKEHFLMDDIHLKLLDRSRIRITDKNNDTAIITYKKDHTISFNYQED